MHREDLHGDSLFLIHDFLTPEECQRSIEFSEGRDYHEISHPKGYLMDTDVCANRRDRVEARSLAGRLCERSDPFLPPRIGSRYLLRMNDRFRYHRYEGRQTFYQSFNGRFGRNDYEQSQLKFLIYLNDDFTGGATEFYADDGAPRASVKPKRGMALVFAPDQLHEEELVTHGRKYILSTDVLYHELPAGVGFRVMVAQMSPSPFDRSAGTMAAVLQDARFEVIYSGRRETYETIVNDALQEDADAILVAALPPGSHRTVFPEILDRMAARGMKDVLLLGGGIIPPKDADELAKRGVGRLFGPGTDAHDLVKYLAEEIPRRRSAPAGKRRVPRGPQGDRLQPMASSVSDRLRKVDEYFAGYFGCTPDDLIGSKTLVVPYASPRGYDGTQLFRHGQACIVSVAEGVSEAARQKLRSTPPDRTFDLEFLAKTFAVTCDLISPPAWVGVCDRADFNPAPTAARLLTARDSDAIGRLAQSFGIGSYNRIRELFSDQSTHFGLFEGSEMVAASSYIVMGDLLANIRVVTHRAHRRTGHTEEVVSAALNEAFEKGLVPLWDSRGRSWIWNELNVTMARSLGFQPYASKIDVQYV